MKVLRQLWRNLLSKPAEICQQTDVKSQLSSLPVPVVLQNIQISITLCHTFFSLNIVFMHLFQEILVGNANDVDPDQTIPWGAVWSGSAVFACVVLLGKLVYKILGHSYYIFCWRNPQGAVWSGSAQFAYVILLDRLAYQILGHLWYIFCWRNYKNINSVQENYPDKYNNITLLYWGYSLEVPHKHNVFRWEKYQHLLVEKKTTSYLELCPILRSTALVFSLESRRTRVLFLIDLLSFKQVCMVVCTMKCVLIASLQSSRKEVVFFPPKCILICISYFSVKPYVVVTLWSYFGELGDSNENHRISFYGETRKKSLCA